MPKGVLLANWTKALTNSPLVWPVVGGSPASSVPQLEQEVDALGRFHHAHVPLTDPRSGRQTPSRQVSGVWTRGQGDHVAEPGQLGGEELRATVAADDHDEPVPSQSGAGCAASTVESQAATRASVPTAGCRARPSPPSTASVRAPAGVTSSRGSPSTRCRAIAQSVRNVARDDRHQVVDRLVGS